MEVGAAVWVRSEADAWTAGTVVERRPVKDKMFELVIGIVKDGEQRLVQVREGETETEEAKPRDVSANASIVKDLIALPVLHEAAILHALELRYDEGWIYTFNGAILIAVNPFQKVPLYSDEILEKYYNHGLLSSQGIEDGEALDPHVYTVADAAYRDMATAIASGTGDSSQSVLISGESGAGKTETTKIVMRYLTVVGAGDTQKDTDKITVMDRVLDSNPILEAFGNARTVRNDNSSRFGKFIELQFDTRGTMRGASVETYLLEKIRIPRHATSERNFHVFYQLHAATVKTDSAIKEALDMVSGADWQFFEKSPGTDYHYANQGGVLELAHLDDGEEFVKLIKALSNLGFETKDQVAAMKLAASLLHLGEIVFEFDAGDDGGGSKIMDDKELKIAAELLGLEDSKKLEAALTARIVKTKTEEYVVRLVPDDAINARDALAKAVYGRLFDWLVDKVNRGIRSEMEDKVKTAATIGVLDIFGFECFAVNSFEQLCINYTNETLQQQFNRYVFKLEQEEYARENITWSFIEFPDNQDCLDLIEGGRRQMPPDGGLLVMLDDECRLPRGSDANYAARVAKTLLKTAPHRISISKKQAVDGLFQVYHYAGPVAYQTKGFLEKNKDELPRAAEQLFVDARQTTKGKLLGDICDAHLNAADSGFKKKATSSSSSSSQNNNNEPPPQKKVVGTTATTLTVAAQFKAQLASLIRAVAETKPHYIRCLKPNDKNVPKAFWRARVAEQLRYGGVLEAVRVARSGFPVRMPHGDFANYYAVVGHEARDDENNKQKLCEKLIEQAAVDCGFAPEEAQLGKTKVFLRKHAHDALEARRAAARVAAATKIAAKARTFLCASSLAKRLKASRLLLRAARGSIGRQRARHLRHFRKAVVIQSLLARGRAKRLAYLRARRGFGLCMAALARGVAARTLVLVLHRDKAAALLNRTLGRGLPRRRQYYARIRVGIVRLQARIRRMMAKAALRRLKAELRDVGKLKQEKEAMKEEIARLKQQAAAATLERETMAAKAKTEELAKLKEAMEAEKRAAIESQRQAELKMRDELLSLQDKKATEIDDLKTALDKETRLRHTVEQNLQKVTAERDGVKSEKQLLKEELDHAKDQFESDKKALLAAAKSSTTLKVTSDQGTAPAVAPAVVTNLEQTIAKLQQELDRERSARLEAEKKQKQQLPPTTPAPSRASNSMMMENNNNNDESQQQQQQASPPPPPATTRTPQQQQQQQQQQAAAPTKATTTTSEDESFREKLRNGIAVAVWEADAAAGDHVSLALFLEDEKPMLTFAPRSRSLFRRTKPPGPIAFADVCSVRPGHSGLCGLAKEDDARFLTLVAEETPFEDPDSFLAAHQKAKVRRDVVVQFASDDAKKDALVGIRHMLAESNLSLSEGPEKLEARTTTPKASPALSSPAQSPAPAYDDAVAELEKQLLLERANNQKMMLQMLEMQNDVNRSSAKIVELKQESAGLRSQLVARDRMHAGTLLVVLSPSHFNLRRRRAHAPPARQAPPAARLRQRRATQGNGQSPLFFSRVFVTHS